MKKLALVAIVFFSLLVITGCHVDLDHHDGHHDRHHHGHHGSGYSQLAK